MPENGRVLRKGSKMDKNQESNINNTSNASKHFRLALMTLEYRNE